MFGTPSRRPTSSSTRGASSTPSTCSPRRTGGRATAEIEVRLVRLRNAAYAELDRSPTESPWPDDATAASRRRRSAPADRPRRADARRRAGFDPALRLRLRPGPDREGGRGSARRGHRPGLRGMRRTGGARVVPRDGGRRSRRGRGDGALVLPLRGRRAASRSRARRASSCARAPVCGPSSRRG